MFFEGAGFFLRPKGAAEGGFAGLDQGLTWGDFLSCQASAAVIGADCWGAAQPAVRYDFADLGRLQVRDLVRQTSTDRPNRISWSPVFVGNANDPHFDTAFSDDQDFWDVAVFYTADWNSIKLSAAAAFTWIETAVRPATEADPARLACSIMAQAFDGLGIYEVMRELRRSSDLYQIGASIMHKPSGLGIYGL